MAPTSSDPFESDPHLPKRDVRDWNYSDSNVSEDDVYSYSRRRSYYDPGVPAWASRLPPTPDVAAFFVSLSALDGHEVQVHFDGSTGNIDEEGNVHLPHLNPSDSAEARLENMAISGTAVHERAHLFCDSGKHFYRAIKNTPVNSWTRLPRSHEDMVNIYKNALNTVFDIADEARLTTMVPGTAEFLEVKNTYMLARYALSWINSPTGVPPTNSKGEEVLPLDSTRAVMAVLQYKAMENQIRDPKLIDLVDRTLHHLVDLISHAGFTLRHVQDIVKLIKNTQAVPDLHSGGSPARPDDQVQSILQAANTVGHHVHVWFPDLPVPPPPPGEGDGEGEGEGKGRMPVGALPDGPLPRGRTDGQTAGLGHVPAEFTTPPKTLPAAQAMFKRHVRDILLARSSARIKWDTAGRLTLKRPANLFTGGKVFRSKVEDVEVDTAVALILDRSGSMSGIMRYAGALAGGLGCAIAAEGIPFAAWVFDDTPERVQKPELLAKVNAQGGTDAPAAMLVAIQWLIQQSPSNKLLIMFTDGDTGGDVNSVNKLMALHNIRLLAGGLNGMDVSRIDRYFPKAISINCDNSTLYTNFASGIRRLLRTTL